MNLTLYVWRQPGPAAPGRMERYEAADINPDSSFLEMLDVLNERLAEMGEDRIAFDHDCREGICGMCGFMINGEAHGPRRGTTVCQLHMRHFRDGDVLHLEPWRARAFPVVKDLMVDRRAFDRVIQAGGFISVSTGSAPEANLMPVPKRIADRAFEAAECIGCGACVAQCPNAAAQLFTAAKVSHLGLAGDGRGDGAGGFRLLHQPRRVPGGLPEGDLDRFHRAPEPRLPEGPGGRRRARAARRGGERGMMEGLALREGMP